MVESVEFRKNRVLGWPDSVGGALLSQADIRHWLQRSLTQASQDCSSPFIKLLVVEIQDTGFEERSKIFAPRSLFDQLMDLLDPALKSLAIPRYTLRASGSVVFDKLPSTVEEILQCGDCTPGYIPHCILLLFPSLEVLPQNGKLS